MYEQNCARREFMSRRLRAGRRIIKTTRKPAETGNLEDEPTLWIALLSLLPHLVGPSKVGGKRRVGKPKGE